jgi:hypothetical protein
MTSGHGCKKGSYNEIFEDIFENTIQYKVKKDCVLLLTANMV